MFFSDFARYFFTFLLSTDGTRGWFSLNPYRFRGTPALGLSVRKYNWRWIFVIINILPVTWLLTFVDLIGLRQKITSLSLTDSSRFHHFLYPLVNHTGQAFYFIYKSILFDTDDRLFCSVTLWPCIKVIIIHQFCKKWRLEIFVSVRRKKWLSK